MKNYSIVVSGVIASEVTFSHSHADRDFYRFDLEVKRRNEAKDILPVVVPADVPGFDGLSVGDRICVKGYINSNRRDGQRMTYINCYELEAANSEDRDTNSVAFLGYVCGNRGARETADGHKVSAMMVAIPRYHGVSDYVSCVGWGDISEEMKELPMGTKVVIHGRMQSHTYNGRTLHDVSVRRLTVIPPKEDAENPDVDPAA